MPLLFQPEPIDKLKSRYARAIAKAWPDPTYIEDAESYFENTRPGIMREHVFDFEDGTRLVISKFALRCDGNVITITGSKAVRPGEPTVGDWKDLAARYEDLSGVGVERLTVQSVGERGVTVSFSHPVVN